MQKQQLVQEKKQYKKQGNFEARDKKKQEIEKLDNRIKLERCQEKVRLLSAPQVQCLMRLIQYVEAFGMEVGIVLSSSWRDNESFHMLKEIFSVSPFGSYMIDRTVCENQDIKKKFGYSFLYQQHLIREGWRTGEIKCWLKNTCHTIENFVILDDEPYDHQKIFPENFVECDYYKGFNEQKLEEAKAIFDRTLVKEEGAVNRAEVVKNFVSSKPSHKKPQHELRFWIIAYPQTQ